MSVEVPKGKPTQRGSAMPVWSSGDAPGLAPEMVDAGGPESEILADLQTRSLLRTIPEGLPMHGALVELPCGRHGEVCGWLDRNPESSSRVAMKWIAMVEILDLTNPDASVLEQRLFPEDEVRTLRAWPSDTFLRRWAWRLEPKATVQ
jgi:hypothetical protein